MLCLSDNGYSGFVITGIHQRTHSLSSYTQLGLGGREVLKAYKKSPETFLNLKLLILLMFLFY
jgi:hypothetical protein